MTTTCLVVFRRKRVCGNGVMPMAPKRTARFFYCGENAAGVHGETNPAHGDGIDKQTKRDRYEEMVNDGGGDGAAGGV